MLNVNFIDGGRKLVVESSTTSSTGQIPESELAWPEIPPNRDPELARRLSNAYREAVTDGKLLDGSTILSESAIYVPRELFLASEQYPDASGSDLLELATHRVLVWFDDRLVRHARLKVIPTGGGGSNRVIHNNQHPAPTILRKMRAAGWLKSIEG